MTTTLHDLAALAPLGILTDDEAAELARLEAAGGDDAFSVVRAYNDAVVQLADSLEPVTPPADVRRKVMQAVAPPGRILRANEGRWFDLAPGVRLKKLSSDRSRNTVTVLVTMDAGSTLPAHDHRHAEESFVVRGSCHVGELSLRQGDFHRVEAGAHHSPIVSDEGCDLLVVMDAEDYLAA
jgi:anti-sigma factor ChrR (cupin superfamily)